MLALAGMKEVDGLAYSSIQSTSTHDIASLSVIATYSREWSSAVTN